MSNTPLSQHLKPSRISPQAQPLSIPADKSITHRAFLFSLLSSRKSRIHKPLMGADCLASLDAVEKLGAKVTRGDGFVEIEGFGIKDFGVKNTSAENPLLIDCLNSGTTMRLLCGLLSYQKAFFRLVGDASLSRRPMERVSKPLTEIGASVSPVGSRQGVRCPPVEIAPSARHTTRLDGLGMGMQPHVHTMKVPSAQVKSAILLASLWCPSKTFPSVIESVMSRDHTERLLKEMGVDVKIKIHPAGNYEVTIEGMLSRDLAPVELEVPGDPSSAAFWICAALLQDRKLEVKNILLNVTRLGFIQILKRMGADISLNAQSKQGGEDVGRAQIQGNAKELFGVEVSADEVPSLIDEIPVLALVAAWATGQSVFKGVEELRVKESDRLQAIVDLLTFIGVKVWVQGNDLYIEGCSGNPPGPKEKNWNYITQGDHRLAMTAIVAADALRHEITIDDVDCIKVSYPEFFDHRGALSR